MQDNQVNGAGPTAAVEWGLSQLTLTTEDRHERRQPHWGWFMTALAILTSRERIIVVTDTLSVGAQEQPAAFTSKTLILPHLHMVIAARGVFGIAEAFFDQIRSSPYRDAHAAIRIAPELLRYFWAECVKFHSLSKKHSVEVFLIAVDTGTGACACFGFRSQNDFEVERLPEGAVHPDGVADTLRRLADEAKLASVGRRQATADTCWIAVADDQRREYISAGKPYAVGGRLNVTELTPHAITTRTVFTFDGFDDIAAQMTNRLSQPPSVAAPKPSGWLRRFMRGSR